MAAKPKRDHDCMNKMLTSTPKGSSITGYTPENKKPTNTGITDGESLEKLGDDEIQIIETRIKDMNICAGIKVEPKDYGPACTNSLLG